MRPLPDIDLARIAPQPDDMKRKSLEQMKGGFSRFSYSPLRRSFGDIFNIQPDLNFGSSRISPWPIIEELVLRRSKSAEEFKHNKRVARGLYDFAAREGIMGRKHDFFPLSMSVGRKVTFWLPMILAIENQAHAMFVEPRRSKGLNAEGRRFAFSMMHERIRAADEDFANVRLAIVRFGAPENEYRAAKLYTDEGIDLYTLDELELMVASTYDMWREVTEEREAETRRRSTGTGPLI